ncbi:MAG: transposase family protein, partial [Woeseiaceae bacterium]
IRDHYSSETARSGIAAFGKYVTLCGENSVDPLSYSTYMKYIKKMPRDKLDQERHGRRYALQNSGPISQGLEALPANGDRVWETAHIDHTPADIELVSKLTGENLGQPWLTLMIDAWTRMILAFVLSFRAPSARTLMMIIRECVRRWGRLPNKLVVDRGPDFRSTYFDRLLSGFNVGKLLRPSSQPRFGSPGERLFGTANTQLIHQLVGNTKNRTLRRGLSSSHDPAKFAVWTPDSFAELLEEWAFDIYPTLENRAIAESPKDRFERSIRNTGARDLVRIPYNDAFLFATLPEPSKGPTRKVHKGTISFDHIQYRGRFSSINPFNGQTGHVRLEPDDPSKSWIFLNKEWHELVCTNDLIREYVERGVRHSRLELEARLSRAGKRIKDIDASLIDFMDRAAIREQELAAQKRATQAIVSGLGEPAESAPDSVPEELLPPPIVIPTSHTATMEDFQ